MKKMKKLLLFTISILMLTGCQKDKSDVNSIQIQEIHAYAKSKGLTEKDYSVKQLEGVRITEDLIAEIKAVIDNQAPRVHAQKARNKVWDEFFSELEAKGLEVDSQEAVSIMKDPKYSGLFKDALEENNQ